MKQAKLLVAALAACGLMAGCTAGQNTVSYVERTLTVTGPSLGVERFVALQGSLRPRIAVSQVMVRADGQAEAIVSIPLDHASEDLVHTTREALAAGLGYEYNEVRLNRAARS